jgi:hypothetical protein
VYGCGGLDGGSGTEAHDERAQNAGFDAANGQNTRMQGRATVVYDGR